jgi:hypothetical protein
MSNVLFDDADWRRRGLGGFTVIGGLGRPEPLELPEASGVYVVLRASSGRPEFLAVGGGGWWKGNDPTVSIERLESRWVDGTPTLYIGKAKSLRERVGELLRFSDGEAVRHWGGRLLWQLGGAQDFLLGWREEPDFGGVETDLIDEFLDHFGQLPFANLKRGDRVAGPNAPLPR